MAQHGQILGFRRYRVDQLVDTADQLQIPLDPSELQRCEKHYRAIEKRDPYIEELRLLAKLKKTNLPNFALSDFSTDRSDAARTFSDLTAKMNRLHKNAKTPWQISEYASLANDCLERAGANKPADFFPLFSWDLTKKTPTGFFAFPKFGMEEIREQLILVDRPEGSFDAIRKLAGTPNAKAVKNGVSCCGCGILQNVLSLTDAVYIDASKLGDLEKESFADVLTESQLGKTILRIASESFSAISDFLRNEGCTVTLFGIVPNEKKVSVFVDRDTLFSMDTDFVQSFFRGYERSVSLLPPPRNASSSIDGVYRRNENREIVFRAETNLKDVTEGVTLQYLSSVTALALSGVFTWEMQVFPFFGADTPERTVEALLASYRFQSELSVSGTPVFLPTPSYRAVMFARAKGNGAPPREPYGDGTRLFFLDFTGFSETDYQDLKKGLKLLAEEAQSGFLLSAVLFKNEYLSHQINDYCGDRVRFCPFDEMALYGKKVSLGLLAESSHPLPFPEIGTLQTV